MGHCNTDSMQDSNNTVKMPENNIETKQKVKMKNNTYDKIKRIVSNESEKIPRQTEQKVKSQKKNNIGF